MKKTYRRVIFFIFLFFAGGSLMLKPVSVVKALFSYQFEPDSGYSQDEQKAVLRIYPGATQTDNPARVDWLDPSGTKVSYCATGSCGVSYDQDVAANGLLNWRAFYFYISGQSRVNGTYTAVAYRYAGTGMYSEIFRASFTISGTIVPPTPTPTPVYIGEPDKTFGKNGVIENDFPGTDAYGDGVIVQPDGKILTVMVDFNTNGLEVARNSPNGSLDTAFGTGGLAIAPSAGYGHSYSLALQQDGKIVAAGFSLVTGTGFDFALARFNTDGSLDAAFNSGKLVTTDFGGDDTAYGLAIQPDGKILAAGYSETPTQTGHVDSIALARYNTDGSLDGSFGTGGKVTTTFGSDSEAFAVAAQPDGKIVAAGFNYDSVKDLTSFLIARYTSIGSLDTGFGTGGLRTDNFFRRGGAKAVAVQPDGKILAAGTTYYYSSSLGAYAKNFAVARYTSDGYPDMGFGLGGEAEANMGGEEEAYDMVLLPDGKILLGGTVKLSGKCEQFALARFTSDGNLDTASGTTGTLVGQCAEGYAIASQPDGKAVMAGSGNRDVIIARFTLKTDKSNLYLPMIKQ